MKTKGFTATEVLVSVGIAALILAAVAMFLKDALGSTRSALLSLNAELDGRRAMREMVFDLRKATSVEATSTNSITFDGGKRYFLDGERLMREEGSLVVFVSGVKNGTTTPLFEYNGRFVKINLLINGRSFVTGLTFRNL